MVTAILGAMVFKESLPGALFWLHFVMLLANMLTVAGTWWLGASFLVAGSVIIGRRDEAQKESASGKAGEVDGSHESALAAGGVKIGATNFNGTKRKTDTFERQKSR